MDLFKAIRDYIYKAVRMTSGMKVLLLDDETTSIVSTVFAQSEILQEEVYLFEKINISNRETMSYLQAICFLRPTAQNLKALEIELKKPLYGSYYIYFTNHIDEDYLHQLSRYDIYEVVKEVQEFYADYIVINPDTFTLNIPGVLNIDSRKWESNLERMVDGISACLLSLKMRPVIRAQASSTKAVRLARSLKSRIESSSSFRFGKRGQTPLLLLMDRNEDPVTPLLTPWTYQAMLHELLGIKDNIIELHHSKKKLERVVVSCMQDDFFLKNMYNDFGDLGISLKEFVDEFYRKSKNNKKLESIDDIKNFIENYPDFKKESGNVTKHVSLVEKLHEIVFKRNLLIVSKIEQKLACHEDHDNAVQSVRGLLDGSLLKAEGSEGKLHSEDALRIVLLYSLRYQNHSNNQIEQFANILLRDYQIPPERARLIRLLKEYSQESKRTPQLDLFENQKWMASVRGKIKRGIVGVTNVYTQHQPLLQKVINFIRENKLDENSFPYYLGNAFRPQDIFIFVVGGITFEEVAMINKLNNELEDINLIIGGSTIHNSSSFMESILNNQ